MRVLADGRVRRSEAEWRSVMGKRQVIPVFPSGAGGAMLLVGEELARWGASDQGG